MSKKEILLNLALICCMAGGFLIARWNLHSFFWVFTGGVLAGAAGMLMILNYFGQRQLKKALKIVDKRMKDRVVEIESDNEIYTADE